MKTLLIAATAVVVLPSLAQAPKSMQGTWVLQGDKSTRMVFNKNGSFSYAGWGATSRGTWKYDGKQVHLVWTEIDKQRVTPGKVKKSYDMSPAGELVIDKYRYRKG